MELKLDFPTRGGKRDGTNSVVTEQAFDYVKMSVDFIVSTLSSDHVGLYGSFSR